jgi:hypothetical protein
LRKKPVISENPNLLKHLTFSSIPLTLNQQTFAPDDALQEVSMLPPVVSALLAYVATLFRSSASLRLENLALRH